MASCLKLIFSFFPSLTTFSLSHFKEPKYQVEIGLFQLLKEKLLSLEALIDFWLLKFCRSFSRGKEFTLEKLPIQLFLRRFSPRPCCYPEDCNVFLVTFQHQMRRTK